MFFIAFVVALIICLVFVIINLMIGKKVVYKDLNRRHVVITGGSSGIGKAAAIESAKLGAHVTIIGRDVNRLHLAVKDITQQCLNKESQIIQYIVLDVTSDYKTIEKSLSSIEAEVGPIFMLVNCAGMCICGQFEKMEVDDIKKMIDLNYFGTAYPTKYVLPGMKARDEGIVVFVSSEAAFIGIYGYSAYTAGKWAVRGLAEALNMELIGTNVRLMLAFPPDTDTPGFKNEDLTKPEETKLISGSGGLHSPEAVGKQMIHDALIGKTYSVYSLTGNLLTTLCSISLESAQQVIVQVMTMGILRMATVAILFSFHKIVKNGLKMKHEKERQKTK